MFKREKLALVLLAALPAIASAQTVARDPHSGKLRAATAEEIQALKNANANATANGSAIAVRSDTLPTQQKFHPSGAQGLRLTDEFMSSSVVTRTADGKLVMECLEPGHKDMAPHAAHTSIQPVTE
jgi:hypothetical protein